MNIIDFQDLLKEQNKKRIKRILWLSFLIAVFIYVYIAWTAKSSKENYEQVCCQNAQYQDQIFYIFIVIALIASIISLWIRNKSYKEIESSSIPSSKVPVDVFFMLSMVFSEVSAILGLALFFYSGNFERMLMLCGLSILSLLIVYPRR